MKKIFAVLLAVIMNTSLAYAAGSVIEYVPMNNIAFSGWEIPDSRLPQMKIEAAQERKIFQPAEETDEFSWKAVRTMLEREKAFRSAI